MRCLVVVFIYLEYISTSNWSPGPPEGLKLNVAGNKTRKPDWCHWETSQQNSRKNENQQTKEQKWEKEEMETEKMNVWVNRFSSTGFLIVNKSTNTHSLIQNSPERSRTVQNSPERSWTVLNGPERSWTVLNGPERSRAVLNGPERSWCLRQTLAGPQGPPGDQGTSKFKCLKSKLIKKLNIKKKVYEKPWKHSNINVCLWIFFLQSVSFFIFAHFKV